MSISRSWRIVQTSNSWKRLSGTVGDWIVFENIFGRRNLTRGDINKLVSMHRSVGRNRTLWGDLADALNELPDGVEIEVKGEH